MDNELKIVIKARNDASAALKKVKSDLGGVANSTSLTSRAFDKLKTAAKAGAVATLAGASALAVYSFNQFRDIQKSVAGVQALTKNTKEAKKVLKDAIGFVQGKPFDRLDTIGASKQLLAFGRTASEIKEDLKTLGNTVLVSGLEWQNVTRVYGRVVASGKLLREDFNILNDAGVGLAKTLQEELGTNMSGVFELMEDGEISAEQFQRALKKAAPDSVVEASLNTFDNKLMSLKASLRDVAFSVLGVDFDQLDKNGRPLVEPGGLLDRLQDGIESATTYLRSPEFKAGLERFTNWLSQNVPKAIKFLTETVWPALRSAFETLAPIVGRVIEKLGQMMLFITNNKPVLIGLIATIVSLKTVMAIGRAVAAFQIGMAAMQTSIATTRARLIAFRALAASPVSMGAITVAAALASIYSVYKAVQSVRQAIIAMNNTAKANDAAYKQVEASAKKARDMMAAGNSLETQKRGRQLMNDLRKANSPETFRAGGGSVNPAQSYVVGERQAEIFQPNTRGRIQPTAADTGMGKVTNILSGNFYFENQESVDTFFNRIDKTARLSKLGVAR